MNLQKILSILLVGSPVLAFAHPGHTYSTLHLHIGTPSTQAVVDPSIIAAGLLVVSVSLIFSLQKRP